MMKVAVIGAGYWGKKHVEEYVSLGADVTVADLLDGNLEICKQKYGVKTTRNYEEILRDPRVEAISICTPNDTHYDICKNCLLAGMNVLVEKPLATNIQHAIELVQIAETNRLVFVVGHVYRFNNAIRKLKEFFNKGTLGTPRILKFKWTNFQPCFEDRDVIADLVAHPFDIINFLFGGDPNEIACVGNAYRRKVGAEAVFINCRLKDVIINIELSWITPPKERTLVCVGSDRMAIVDCLNQKVQLVDLSTNHHTEVSVLANNTIRDELDNFLTCVKNKDVSIANGEVGVNSIRMIEYVKRALEEKRALYLDARANSLEWT